MHYLALLSDEFLLLFIGCSLSFKISVHISSSGLHLITRNHLLSSTDVGTSLFISLSQSFLFFFF